MTRILVPPGIGDIYWVLVKLRGFLEAHDITEPEIWIDAPNERKRAMEFIGRVPFVRAGGYHDHERPDVPQPMHRWKRRTGHTDPVREEAYLRNERHVFPNVDGFDWFISYNGSINAGQTLAEADPQWAADWDIDFTISDAERLYGRELHERIGPYWVSAFFSEGFYKRWLAKLPAAEIYKLLAGIHDDTGHKIVLTGAYWDLSDINRELLALDAPHGRLISLIGETTLEQYFGALRAAEGCVGFPAGNTMLGPAFGVPTTIIWHDFFDRRMHVNTVMPDSGCYAAANCSIQDWRQIKEMTLNLKGKP